MIQKWTKPILTLLVVAFMAWYLPATSLDPWNLLSPKKIATMLFALVFIQIFGTLVNRILGPRTGAILTGFFGGLVSSTATTASLARKSKTEEDTSLPNEMLIFLSATGAMLIEGFVLVWTGTSRFHGSILLIFSGPLLATGAMIFFYSRKQIASSSKSEKIEFNVLPILKLAFFILSILILSKLLQKFFGQYGLMILTFLVSLFEIHGSVIANVQLHENGIVSTKLLGHLVAISIVASYLSKIFLIWTLGSQRLRSSTMKSTLLLFATLSITWLISSSISVD